jgi:hypothetical protein
VSTSWDLLDDELRQWSDHPATLWWRDDDAASDSAALAALLSIARDHDVAIALAAIPATVDATLVGAIDRSAQATVVQHGYAHANHARSGERSVELGGEQSLEVVLDELQRGRDVLSGTFAQRFRSILVPPWNRIAEPLIPRLAGIGLRGLSCFGPRPTPLAAPGVAFVNTHVDLIAWKRGRTFIGEAAAITRIVAHLAARRRREVDDEPTGVLTHHLAFDDDAFAFLRDLMARTSGHRHVRWLDVDAAFQLSDALTFDPAA